ncbi:MAG: SPOR domain-containing protein [Gemmatimonadetes bacterium]|nr:SPOR domain-containing protein [Gemmatimonadota bacterium]
MLHTSLDEGFWRSATEALAPGRSLDEDPSLAELSRLMARIRASSARHPGLRLHVLTLGATEEERALGLLLAALVARCGPTTLLVDLDFADDTWGRLLGSEELAGIVDHVELGIAVERLVRPTSWAGLQVLPGGTASMNPDLVLRSDKVRGCVDDAAADHDVVCIGLPLQDFVHWSQGGLHPAHRSQAVLLGPSGDELAFEYAMPKLVQRVELLATFDVPPLGRWRHALTEALPTVDPRVKELGEREPARTPVHAGSAEERDSEPGRFYVAPAPEVAAPAPEGIVHGPQHEVRSSSISRALRHARPDDLSGTHASPRADPRDREAAADVEFLARLSGEEPPASPVGEPRRRRRSRHARGTNQERLDLPPPVPPEDPPPFPSGWDRDDESEEGEGLAYARTADRGGGWGTTLLGLLACILIGAAGFWYWRSTRQIPDGEFTFVDSSDTEDAAGPATRTAARGPQVTATGVEPGPDEVEEAARGAVVGKAEGVGDDGEGAVRDEGAAGEDAGGGGESESVETSAGAAFDPPTAGPVVGYSLHVGSFQTFAAADRAAAALRGAGRTAFVVPVLLEGKGEWYRVFTGVLEDRAVAQTSLVRSQGEGLVKDGAVRETPWALYLGTYETRDEAAAALSRLHRSGVSAYLVGTEPVHVYAGAFESAADAELLNRQLRDRGFETELVKRREADRP